MSVFHPTKEDANKFLNWVVFIFGVIFFIWFIIDSAVSCDHEQEQMSKSPQYLRKN